MQMYSTTDTSEWLKWMNENIKSGDMLDVKKSYEHNISWKVAGYGAHADWYTAKVRAQKAASQKVITNLGCSWS